MIWTKDELLKLGFTTYVDEQDDPNERWTIFRYGSPTINTEYPMECYFIERFNVSPDITFYVYGLELRNDPTMEEMKCFIFDYQNKE